MQGSDIEKTALRLCRSINDSTHNWRYFHALFEFSAVYKRGTLVSFKRFLMSTENAHLAAAVSGLYTLLDTNGAKYVTLANFRNMLAGTNPVLAQRIDILFAVHEKAIRSVTLLRHQYIAHRPMKNDEEGAFSLAKFEDAAVGRLVDDLADMYLLIGGLADRKYVAPPSAEKTREEVSQFLELAIEAYLPRRQEAIDKLHTRT